MAVCSLCCWCCWSLLLVPISPCWSQLVAWEGKWACFWDWLELGDLLEISGCGMKLVELKLMIAKIVHLDLPLLLVFLILFSDVWSSLEGWFCFSMLLVEVWMILEARLVVFVYMEEDDMRFEAVFLILKFWMWFVDWLGYWCLKLKQCKEAENGSGLEWFYWIWWLFLSLYNNTRCLYVNLSIRIGVNWLGSLGGMSLDLCWLATKYIFFLHMQVALYLYVILYDLKSPPNY